MTRVFLLLTIFTLVACESDFDKCMSTELPRAERLFGVEAEREVERRLVAMHDYIKLEGEVEFRMKSWFDENPTPNYPEYPTFNDCSEAADADFLECSFADDKLSDKLLEEWEAAVQVWESTSDGRSWLMSKDEEMKRVNREVGLPLIGEEAEHLVSEFMEVTSTLLEPRSPIYRCYEDYKCDEYRDAEYDDVMDKAFKEAIQFTATEIKERPLELATVTCNNNGFYE
ncbi:hypothetical protein N9I66_07395 [Pseudomonadales bacterium]|nr:hypothetical protein [Pseudomonadales bacterium]